MIMTRAQETVSFEPRWLLERYCLRQIGTAFVLAFAVVAAALWLNFALQAVRLGTVAQGDPRLLALSAVLALLSTASILFPVALLVAAIQVASRMRADGEFLAAQGAGVSWQRMARAFVLAGTVTTLVSLATTHLVEPRARRALNRVLQLVAGSVFLEGGEPHRLGPSSSIEVVSGSPANRWVVVSGRSAKGTETTLVGRPDQIALDPSRAEVTLRLADLTAIEVNADGAYRVTRADTLQTRFPLKLGTSMGVTALSSDALCRRVQHRRQSGLPYGRDRLELEKRFAFPFACVAFALLGLPLGYVRTGGDRGYGYLVSALVILGYYSVVRVADGWADLHPTAARLLVWLPNGVPLGAALMWLHRRDRGR